MFTFASQAWEVDWCCKLVFVHFNPQLVILSSHFQVGWGASTRETVKKFAIKSLALCTMERKDAREAVLSEKGRQSESGRHSAGLGVQALAGVIVFLAQNIL